MPRLEASVATKTYSTLVVGCSSPSLHHLLACLSQSPCKVLCHRLRLLGLDDTLHPHRVSRLAQWTALLAQVCQVHVAKLPPKPSPEKLHRVQVGTFGGHSPQGDISKSFMCNTTNIAFTSVAVASSLAGPGAFFPIGVTKVFFKIYVHIR